jgi:hypothetical protein
MNGLEVIPVTQKGHGKRVPHNVWIDSLLDQGLFTTDRTRQSTDLCVSPLSSYGPLFPRVWKRGWRRGSFVHKSSVYWTAIFAFSDSDIIEKKQNGLRRFYGQELVQSSQIVATRRINLVLPPTTLWAGQFPSREDCDLKVRVHAGSAAGRAAKRPLQPVVRHDWIFPTF